MDQQRGSGFGWCVGIVLALASGCGDGSSAAGADSTGVESTAAGESGSTTAAVTTSGVDTADGTSTTGEPSPMWRGPGPYPIGHVRTTLQLDSDRVGAVQWWYPAATAGARTPLEDLEPPGADRDTLAALVDAAPPDCTRVQVESTAELAPADGDPMPVVVFSHCNECTRYSSAQVAEQLASWGFVVVAPDHTDNTLFDARNGTSVGVAPAFLATRGGDIVRVIDAVEQGGDDVPAALRGRLDAGRLGVMGHSFGSVTAGWVAERDDRVRAAVGIAAPMDNPLLPGVSIGAVDVPLLLLLAQEDNSILEIGNNLLRGNFDAAPGPAWLVEFVDAGHWSFSDLCGIVDDFAPGCGEGVRQTVPGQAFTYADAAATRALAADWITTFFAAHLQGDAAAAAWLADPPADDATTVRARP